MVARTRLDSRSDAQPSPRGEPTPRPARRGLAARLARAGLALVAGAAVLALTGFLWFVHSVVGDFPSNDEKADGIVVLTGGRDRILIGLEFLRQGRGRRLLISGVNPATTAADILRSTEADPSLFACCVDLGHQAETTIGNALEADIWARANRFDSLIVVTSAYHMPRALLELDSSLPEVRLIPQPVKRPDLHLETWYRQPGTVKLLTAEYLKYILARVRLGLESLGRE